MAVFGVDFGNLNCVVSTARKGGIDIITNEVSKRETAAFVSFGEKQRFLGEKAADQQVRNWSNTVGCLKRLIGVKFDSEAARNEQRFVKNVMRSDDKGFIELKCRYKWEEHWFKPEQLVGALFTQLRKYAELESSTQISDCVVSVPVYYTSAQRKLLQQALSIAGLSPLTFINETTAAALDWGIFKSTTLPEDEKEAEVISIVDVGHSATTCSIVTFTKCQLKVLGHVFDRNLGSRDFDFVLFQHFTKEIQLKYRQDINENKKNSIKLLQAIDKFKKILSANPIAPLNCELAEFDVQFPDITRESIEDLWKPLLVQLQRLCANALQIPGADRVTSVEVIGGGSRIPCVKTCIADSFKKPLKTTLNASETVAKGCGIMAAMLSPKFKVREYSVIDANVFTVNLGYYTDKPTNTIQDPNFPEINKKMVIVKPGDVFPKTFNLTFDRSQNFELLVFYEDVPDVISVGNNLLIGKYRISKIPNLGSDQPSVKVRLRLSPSMSINVEGAFVTEEWEEEEIVEIKKEKKEEKKEEKNEETKEETKKETMSNNTTNENADKPTPMETDEPVETEKKIVKKKKRHDCVVEVLYALGHPEPELNILRDLEKSMIQSDRNVQETQECKNNVESYIYDMRSKVNAGGLLSEYITEKERENFLQTLSSAEEWLYGDGDDCAKEDYQIKLKEMSKIGNLVNLRYNTRLELKPAITIFLQKANEIRAQANNADGKLAHISAEELHSVVLKTDEFITWITNESAKAHLTPKTHELPLLAAQVVAKQKELTDFAEPILSKPKPKEEKKVAEDKKVEEDNNNNKQSPPPIPTENNRNGNGRMPENKMDLD